MTKAEIVAEIAQRTGMEKVNIQETVEEFMNVLKGSLKKGENVYLRGFGSFIIKKRAEKTGRNISKNTTIIHIRLIAEATQFTVKMNLAKECFMKSIFVFIFNFFIFILYN